jgi:hypothetical protein
MKIAHSKASIRKSDSGKKRDDRMGAAMHPSRITKHFLERWITGSSPVMTIEGCDALGGLPDKGGGEPSPSLRGAKRRSNPAFA